MGHSDIMGIDLDEFHPECSKTTLQLWYHFIGIVCADESNPDEALGPLSDILGHQIIPSIRVSEADAIETGDVDAGIVHGTQEALGIIILPEPTPIPQVCVKINYWNVHDLSHPQKLLQIAREDRRVKKES